MKKHHIARLLGLVLCIYPAATHANTAINECAVADAFVNERGVVRRELFMTQAKEEWYLDGLYPIDATVLAITHLQASCCTHGLLPSYKCPSSTLPSVFHDSTRVFDQVFDIGMRRMDGYANGIYGQEEILDPAAKARRTYINERGTNINGTPPGMILGHFNSTVAPTASDTATPTLPPIINGTPLLERCNTLPQYESLSARIGQQCDVAFCVTSKLRTFANTHGKHMSRTSLSGRYEQCKTIQQDRIIQEYETTKTIMKMQATVLSNRAQVAYLQTYFVDTRLTTLAEKITKMVSALEIINGKYTEGTKTCS